MGAAREKKARPQRSRPVAAATPSVLADAEARDTETGGRREAMTPQACREYLQRAVQERFPEIAEGFAEAACSGGVAHMKLVAALLGLDETPRPAGPGVVERLLEELANEQAAGSQPSRF